MRALKRRAREDKVRDKAANRLRTVSSGQVMTWTEQAINGFHQNLDAYRLHNDVAALVECRKSISMIAGAMDVLEERKQD